MQTRLPDTQVSSWFRDFGTYSERMTYVENYVLETLHFISYQHIKSDQLLDHRFVFWHHVIFLKTITYM